MEGFWHLVQVLRVVGYGGPLTRTALEQVFGSPRQAVKDMTITIRRWWAILTPYEGAWLKDAVSAALEQGENLDWRSVQARRCDALVRERHVVAGRNSAANALDDDPSYIWGVGKDIRTKIDEVDHDRD